MNFLKVLILSPLLLVGCIQKGKTKMGQEFLKMPHYSFVKTKCSPETDSSEKDALSVNHSKVIEWGETLPVCAFLRVSKLNKQGTLDLQFSFTANNKHIYRNVYRTFAGSGDEKKDQFSQEMVSTLEKNQETYLNFPAMEGTSMDLFYPGTYTLKIYSNFGLYVENVSEFKVLDSGWKSKLAKTIAAKVCDQGFRNLVDPYLTRLSILARKNYATQGALKRSLAKKDELGRAAFDKSTFELSLEDHKSLVGSSLEFQSGLSHYVFENLSKDCFKDVNEISVRDIEKVVEGYIRYSGK